MSLRWPHPPSHPLILLTFPLSDTTMYPVPIKVLNYRESGVMVNLDSDGDEQWDRHRVRLFGRFFLYDTVSALSSRSSTPAVAVVAQDIRLHVNVRDDSNNRIYPPILTVKVRHQHGSFTTFRFACFALFCLLHQHA